MNGEEPNSGEWSEWRRLVIHEIKRLNANLEITNERYIVMQGDISRLKLISAMFGAMGGIVITLIAQKLLSG